MILYELLPPALRDGLQLYIEQHVKPGDFLLSALSNDLMTACCRADLDNRRSIADVMDWLLIYAPASAFGSEAKVEAWLRKGEAIEL